MSLTYDDLKTWSKALKTAKAGVPSFLEGFMKTEAMRVHAEIKRGTPVGKKNGGTLRSRWAADVPVTVEGSTIVATFSNPTFYGPFVEEGHHLRNGAWWEGYHFTRIPIDKESQVIGTRFAAKFDRWLRGLGVG